MILNTLIIIVGWLLCSQLLLLSIKSIFNNVFNSFVQYQCIQLNSKHDDSQDNATKKQILFYFNYINLITLGLYNLLLVYIVLRHVDMQKRENAVNVRYFLMRYKK